MRPSFRMTGLLLALLAGTLAVPAQAADRGWYLGMDAVRLQTTLDYVETETYNTSHARFRAGYQFLDFLSFEGRIMTPGNDTDVDFLGDTYQLDTGTILGVYVRPHTKFAVANVYGIIGFTTLNARYRPVSYNGPTDSDVVIASTIGVGGTFRLARNLFFDIEATAYAGAAEFDSYFVDYVDLYSSSVSAGLRFKF